MSTTIRYGTILYILYGWTGIITLLGMGRKYFDFHNSLTDYFSKSSFCVYIIHMPILVVAGFFVLKISAPVTIQFLLIVLISFAATFLIYEIVKRIPVLRFLLGVHRNKQNKAA